MYCRPVAEMATTRITEAVPMTMPSAVRAKRTFAARKLSTASLAISPRPMVCRALAMVRSNEIPECTPSWAICLYRMPYRRPGVRDPLRPELFRHSQNRKVPCTRLRYFRVGRVSPSGMPAGACARGPHVPHYRFPRHGGSLMQKYIAAPLSALLVAAQMGVPTLAHAQGDSALTATPIKHVV